MLARLHTFIRGIARKERSGFVKGETITEAINSASSSLWRAKIKQFRAGGDDILLQPFKASSLLSSPYQLPSAVEYEIIDIRSTDESTPEIVLTRNETQFNAIKTSQDYDHITKSQFTATINVADNGFEDLPNDTFSIGEVFYHNYNGSLYEGQILEDREFLDRKNSVIIPATEEEPIARVVDNKIEFYPKPTGGDTYNYTVPYNKFNPLARYYVSGSNVQFSFLPTDFSDQVRVFYYKSPEIATATYAFSSGIETVTVTNELDWAEQAFPELALRALAYIGIPINNQLIMQAESIMERNDQVDAQE